MLRFTTWPRTIVATFLPSISEKISTQQTFNQMGIPSSSHPHTGQEDLSCFDICIMVAQSQFAPLILDLSPFSRENKTKYDYAF